MGDLPEGKEITTLLAWLHGEIVAPRQTGALREGTYVEFMSQGSSRRGFVVEHRVMQDVFEEGEAEPHTTVLVDGIRWIVRSADVTELTHPRLV